MGTSADELKRDIEDTRANLGQTLDAIGDRVSPSRVMERRRNRMAGRIRTVRERVMGTADGMRAEMSDTAHSWGDAVGERATSAVETVREAPQMVRSQTEGAPLAAGMVALGVGFLTGALIPPTEPERRAGYTLAEKVEPLKQELAEAGQEMAEHLKGPAGEAVTELKETASESAHRVSESARQV